MAYTQAALICVGVIFPGLGFLLVGLRFLMRIRLKIKIGPDDWLILFGSILVMAMAANAILGSYIGNIAMDGLPADPSREIPQQKIIFAQIVFEKPAYGAIKLSSLLLYRRIFTVPRFRAINNLFVAIIVAWTLAFFFADLFQCGAHVDANWRPEVKAKIHCINELGMLLAFAITDVLTDIMILWAPYPEIRKLNLPGREKWALAGMFLLGALDLVIGIVRMAFIIVTQTVPQATGFNALQQTAPTFWTVTEVGIGVTAVNLPAFAPLYRNRSNLLTTFGLSHSASRARHSGDTARLKASPGYELNETPHESSQVSRRDKGGQMRTSVAVGAWNHFERLD